MTFEAPLILRTAAAVEGGYMDDGYVMTWTCGYYMVEPLPNATGVPQRALTDLVKLAGKKVLLDPDLARVWGAIFLAGTKENLKSLAEHPTTETRRKHLSAGTKISPAAALWLQTGEFGLSSYAIFHKMTGCVPPRAPQEATNHPHDPADLRRCLLLLEAVPEFEPRLGEMREVSKVWARLVDSWADLKSTLDEEVRASSSDSWRGKSWNAPMTYKMIQAIIAESQNIEA
jgi:hypothetical protein